MELTCSYEPLTAFGQAVFVRAEVDKDYKQWFKKRTLVIVGKEHCLHLNLIGFDHMSKYAPNQSNWRPDSQ